MKLFINISGIFLEQQEEDLPDVTPVFQTQLPDDIGLHGAEGDKSLAQFQTGQRLLIVG